MKIEIISYAVMGAFLFIILAYKRIFYNAENLIYNRMSRMHSHYVHISFKNLLHN